MDDYQLSRPIRKFIFSIVTLITIAFTLAYFHKPHVERPNLLRANNRAPRIVSAENASKLTEKLEKSYGLALVLVGSEFSYRNAIALEAIRTWADQKFNQDPHFLHPTTLEFYSEKTESIIDSLFFNLLSTPRLALEHLIEGCLRNHIETFHDSEAYKSFLTDYQELFGEDADSQILLAQYESTRAHGAIIPIMCALWWTSVIIFGIYVWTRISRIASLNHLQIFLSLGWLAFAAFYLVSAWSRNEVSIFVSAITCGAIGFYIRYPFQVVYKDNLGLDFKLFRCKQPLLLLATWLSISLVFIRIITWIKIGALIEPDPITLLISSITGDFLHDPAHAKDYIVRFLGIAWLTLSTWVLLNPRSRSASEDEQEHEQAIALAALQFEPKSEKVPINVDSREKIVK